VAADLTKHKAECELCAPNEEDQTASARNDGLEPRETAKKSAAPRLASRKSQQQSSRPRKLLPNESMVGFGKSSGKGRKKSRRSFSSLYRNNWNGRSRRAASHKQAVDRRAVWQVFVRPRDSFGGERVEKKDETQGETQALRLENNGPSA